jgi:peptide/nickel transport system permease protein
LWILLSVMLLGLLTSIAGHNPALQNLDHTLSAPDFAHWLGTDHLGRDLLARLGEAVRVSFWLALGSALLAVGLGTVLGLWAAWQHGWADRLLCLCADGVAAIPGLLWVLLVAALAPGQKWALYSGLVLTAWVEFFRLVRSRAHVTLAGDAVQAGRLLGFGATYLLRWHVLPPLRADLLRLWSYAVANAVLAVAALGFVGVGLRPPTAELGLMMTEALPYYDEAPWLLAGPVLLLVLVVAALQSATRASEKDAE